MIDEKKLIEDILQHENVLASANHVYKSGYRDRQDEIIDIINRQPKVGEWIPVSERLPKELVAVNVTWINRCPENYYMHIKDKPFTDTAVLYQGEWYWWDSTIIDYLSECGTCISGVVNKSIDILAWMPLPEPWKGEVNE